MEDDRLLNRLWKVLGDDYGITTLDAFDDAFKKLPAVDITVFWSLPGDTCEDVRRRYDEKHCS